MYAREEHCVLLPHIVLRIKAWSASLSLFDLAEKQFQNFSMKFPFDFGASTTNRYTCYICTIIRHYSGSPTNLR